MILFRYGWTMILFLLLVDVIDSENIALITRLEETKRKMNDRVN